VLMSQKSMASPTSGFIMCDGEDAPPAVSITIGGSTCVSRQTYFVDPRFIKVLNLIITTCLDEAIYRDRLAQRIATNDAGKPLVYRTEGNKRI
jgi:hypothetical protein